MKPRLSVEWLHACSGCEIALVSGGEAFLDLLDTVELAHFPLLMDNKHGRADKLRLPEADIGVLSGGVAHQQQLELGREMRSRCAVLIACGTCATQGGIPAMLNQWSAPQALTALCGGQKNERGPQNPPQQLSGFLERVYAIDELIPVDLLLPGCPPDTQMLQDLVCALADRKRQAAPEKSVCEHCPTQRLGKSDNHPPRPRRMVQPVEAEHASASLEQTLCLLEQGFLCMGPVTAGGCGRGGAPLCLKARMPCRGCYGPVRMQGNPLLDMMNALASKGIDHQQIIDRKSLLRFCGARGRLRPAKKPKSR